MEATATVFVRHSPKCPDRHRGRLWKKCDCRKLVLAYDAVTRNAKGRLTNRVISSKTRSWAKAVLFAQEWIASRDPVLQENKRLKEKVEAKQVRIEDAVGLYLADLVSRLGDRGTVANTRSFLGRVDTTGKVVRPGRLFKWLDAQVPRPAYVSDLTPSVLTTWRASWKYRDSTLGEKWKILRSFLHFCEGQRWIDDSPVRLLKPPKMDDRSRTVPFTDDQYAAILDACDDQRLETFLELLRWSGMAIGDATLYRPDLLGEDGVLRYRRQKSSSLAVVPLPEHVVIMLRDVPLAADGLGAEQPFRSRHRPPSADSKIWRLRLIALFKSAGINEVRTEHGRIRTPYPHMLRDTCAIWALRHGVSLHTVARMLGHKSTKTTERAYAPWVKELEQSAIEDARTALRDIPRRKEGRVISIAK